MTEPAGRRSRPAPVWLVEAAAKLQQMPASQLRPLTSLIPDLPATGRPAAVLMLFAEGPDGPDVLLLQRASTLRSHAGQPAFPGGTVDLDDDGPAAAALREAREEVGVEPSGVEVLAVLAPLVIPVTGFLVTPVMAWWHSPGPVHVVDTGEVAAVARVPLTELADPANRCLVRRPQGGFVGPGFAVRNMMVWGFTAGLLDRVLQVAGWERPWEPAVERDVPA